MNDDYYDLHESREELMREPNPDEAACHDCTEKYLKEEMTARHLCRKRTTMRGGERWTKEERWFCDECMKLRNETKSQPATAKEVTA